MHVLFLQPLNLSTLIWHSKDSSKLVSTKSYHIIVNYWPQLAQILPVQISRSSCLDTCYKCGRFSRFSNNRPWLLRSKINQPNFFLFTLSQTANGVSSKVMDDYCWIHSTFHIRSEYQGKKLWIWTGRICLSLSLKRLVGFFNCSPWYRYGSMDGILNEPQV